jgi:hypothetical protein
MAQEIYTWKGAVAPKLLKVLGESFWRLLYLLFTTRFGGVLIYSVDVTDPSNSCHAITSI